MTAPLLRMRGHHAVGGDNREPEPACRGEHRVSVPAGPELGVQILWPAELDCLLQKARVSGDENEAVPIRHDPSVGTRRTTPFLCPLRALLRGHAGSGCVRPMNARDGPT